MLNNQAVDTRKVLVELSVIPLGGNGQISDHVATVLNTADKIGLLHERTHNGACIEGAWSDISPLIYACYERVQDHASQGFLKVSIR
ncbi:MAG: hypothetical protein GTO18_00195 [Anaerolineales bacterium]|nr:hypothetical protein [Anaerolineales bacterium]